MDLDSLPDEDLKSLFPRCLATAKYYLGKPMIPFCTPPLDLYPYIIHLFDDLDNEEKETIESDHSNDETCLPYQVQVEVIIKNAKILESVEKVPGIHQAFCKLWIKGGEEQRTSSSDFASSIEWKNECFIFDANDYKTECLKLEIWASSDESTSKKKSRTTLQKIFKKSKGTSSSGVSRLISSTTVVLKNLPSSIYEYQLMMVPAQKGLESKLQFSVQLRAKRTDSSDILIHRHLQIINLCYEKHLSYLNEVCLWKNYVDSLPAPALSLIHQHAIQNGITATEEVLCLWLIDSTLRINEEQRISYNLLYDLLLQIKQHEYKNPLDEKASKAFICSKMQFLKYACIQLTEFYAKFKWDKLDAADELADFLRCIVEIEKPQTSSDFQRYNNMIADASAKWYKDHSQLTESTLPAIHQVSACQENLKNMISEFIYNQIYLDDVFMRSWINSYTYITYEILDEVMNDYVRIKISYLGTRLSRHNNKIGHSGFFKMLQIYHLLRNLVEYIMSKISAESSTLAMNQYPSWFEEDIVLHWFLLSPQQAKPFIDIAVNSDAMEPLSNSIKYGTSVPEVIMIIDDMVTVIWQKLSSEAQLETVMALVDAITACAIEYTKAIIKHIRQTDFFHRDDSFFVINKKLCVSLNNIYAVYSHFHTIRIEIKDTIQKIATESSFGISDSMEIIQYDLIKAVTNAYQVVLNHVKEKMKKLCENLIDSYIGKAKYSDAENELYVFIDNCLGTFFKHLTYQPFVIMLRSLWNITVKKLIKATRRKMHFWSEPSADVYNLISKVLNNLQQMFNCNGNGLSHFEMNDKKYQELKSIIKGKKDKQEN